MNETSGLQRGLLVVFLIMAVCVAARDCLLPPLAYDALTYHAVKAGMWVQQGHPWLMEAPGIWSCARGHPGGGESMLAWAMLPFHDDFLVCLVDFGYWCFLLMSLYALGRRCGLGRRSSSAGAVFCAFVPAVFFSVGACYVDIYAALTLVLAILFAANYFSTACSSCLLLSFLSLGLGGGVKYTVYPAIIVVVAIILIHVVVSGRLSRRSATYIVLGMAGMLMLIGPWLVYNYVLDGNPFYPFGLKEGTKQWGVTSPVMAWQQERPRLIPYQFSTELKVLGGLFFYPIYPGAPTFGILGLIPLLFAPIGTAKLFRQQAWLGLLFSGVAGIIIWAYYSPSFSFIRVTWIQSSARFLLVPFFLATMASLATFKGWMIERYSDLLPVLACVQVIPGILRYWGYFECPYIAGGVVLLIFLAGLLMFLKGRISSGALKAVSLACVAAIVVGAYVLRDHIRYQVAQSSFFFHSFSRDWVAASRLLDDPVVPKTIAVTSGSWQYGDAWFMYFFLGKALQNRLAYIPTSANGAVTDLQSASSSSDAAHYVSWLERLQNRGITEIMSFSPRSIEMEWMDSHPESFNPLITDSQFGVFRLRNAHNK